MPVEDIEKEELERRNRSDILRRQRSEEAQSLISKRTFDARAIFEKNSAAGQLNQRRSSVTTNVPKQIHRRSSEAVAPRVEQEIKMAPVTQEVKVADVPEPRQEVKREPVKEEETFVCNGVNGKSVVMAEEDAQEWEGKIRFTIKKNASLPIVYPAYV